jgi:hypothetical protein
MKFPVSTKVKSNPKLVIAILSVFRCLGVGHIASQCPNKRTMIARVDGEVETESEGNDDQMPPPEDACDDDVEYPVEGESLVARHALSAWNNKGRTFFILDATSTTRYVV